MKIFAFTLLAAATFLTAPAVIDGSPFKADPAFARRGADDPAGDDRRGRGRGTDDGPNHTQIQILEDMMMARRGADDPAGDDRRGRGRGTDDGPNHT